MRVCFLLHELGRAGGMGVIAGHAERLNARPGWQAEVVLTGELDRHADTEWDFALATWWETADALWKVNARRRGVFLQSLEERFYGERELLERLGAASVLALPVDYVTVGSWMRDVLAQLRPDARCLVVRNGIDKAVFAPPAAPSPPDPSRPLRVLVEGNPDMWLKAIPEAVAAVEAMSEPVELTRIEGGLDPARMAAAYADHDVLLKLSRVEGVALPPIEAMHVGTPCVVTPHTGHEEYVRHRQNGLVVGFDDPAAATAALDELARDRPLLARLSEGALRTAAEWPSAEQSTDELARALEELAGGPEPEVAPALAALAARQRLAIELGRGQLGELEWTEQAYEQAKQTLLDLREEMERRLGDKERELREIREERAYKAAARVRRIVRRG
jgi:glycosyltransferase involved in cell wall biosynthesis